MRKLELLKNATYVAWSKTKAATIDLFFSFFPVYVLGLVLFLSEIPESLRERTDTVYLAATLFAEGWWRIYNAPTGALPREDRTAGQIFGFAGAVVASLLAAIMTLSEDHRYSALLGLTRNQEFHMMKSIAVIGSLIYAFIVRWKLHRPEIMEATPQSSRE